MSAKKFKHILSLREMKENIATIHVSRAKSEYDQGRMNEGTIAKELAQQKAAYEQNARGFGTFDSNSCSIQDIQDSMASLSILKREIAKTQVKLEEARKITKDLKTALDAATASLKELRSKKSKLETYIKTLKQKDMAEEMAKEEEDSGELFVQRMAK